MGGSVTAGVGDFHERLGVLRYGTSWTGSNYVRAYAKIKQLGEATPIGIEDIQDGGWMALGGFRSDMAISETQELSLHGHFVKGKVDQTDLTYTQIDPPFVGTTDEGITNNSYSLLGKWSQIFSEDSDISCQAYWDKQIIEYPGIDLEIDNFDIEFNHRFRTGKHEIVWGSGYRLIESKFGKTFSMAVSPNPGQDWIMNAFFQDKINLIPSKFDLVAGLKVEYATLAGKTELQPNLRLLWKPTGKQTLWWSFARSSRSPSITERGSQVTTHMLPEGSLGPDTPVARMVYEGSKDGKSESTVTSEIGYRTMPASFLAMDANLFYAKTDGLWGASQGEPELAFFEGQPYLLIPLPGGNTHDSDSWGGEMAVDFTPASWWRLRTGWSYIRWSTDLISGLDSSEAQLISNNSPQNQFHLWSSFDVLENLGMDAIWRYVDPIETMSVSAYNELDLQLNWQVKSDLKLSISGNNLLNDNHLEFRSTEVVSSQIARIPRHWRANLRWEF